MKRLVVLSLLVTAAVAGAAFVWHGRTGSAKEHEPLPLTGSPIAWQPDLATALEVAARTRKPLMVLFRCEP